MRKDIFRKIANILCVLIGIVCGWFVGTFYVEAMAEGKLFGLADRPIVIEGPQRVMLYLLFIIIFAFLGFISGNYIDKIKNGISNMDNNDKINLILSVILGLILSACCKAALGLDLDLGISAILALILIMVSYQALKSITEQFTRRDKYGNYPGKIKYLDTNIIIDGRIADICKTGFIEGEIVVPKFILLELQLISDSGDSLKRARGRRGLEILNNMQKEMDLTVIDTPYDNIRMEIDTKLMKAAKDSNATIVTNDYNLNQVATLQNIDVLNVNELASALKPVVLPGDQFKTAIMKEGKEKEQGIAYLDDGTMIVVENAKDRLGDIVNIEVSTVLQTVQGKMVFAKILEDLYEPKGHKGQNNTHKKKK
ncbi:MAG: TRAM domain-containing protein [Abditibacteriota bacterium]|nr:TRAM domain-containing protein [Abditibacteriota bacterium]